MLQDNTFDPYRIWLGIPPEEQPPHHYRLLGVRLFETNADVIAHAADSRMIHLKTFQSGQYSALSQQLLNAVSTAKLCLLNPQAKAAYDGQLQQAIRARSAMVERPLSPPMQPPPSPSSLSQSSLSQSSLSPSSPSQSSLSPSSLSPSSLSQSSSWQPPSPRSPPPRSPPVQPPTSPPGPSPEAPLGEELAKIGNRRVSSYVYRRRRTSLAAATVVVTILTVVLGLAILLMAM